MVVYHGTEQASASAMIGPLSKVDVTKGRGELGRGFYVGSEIALSAALARGRHKANPSVLKLTIEDEEFVRLDILTLNKVERVLQLWRRLVAEHRTTMHQFGVDVVAAPFATIEYGHQYKFESLRAQHLLNRSDIKKIL
jgi:hypothetical protein